tara:strand:+ start:178 stop:633 length:456 start_codon:yes stop_codon:yes gene_type:complete
MNIRYEVSGRCKNEKLVHWYVCMLFKELKIHRLSKTFISIEFVTSLDDYNQGECSGDKDEVVIYIARQSKNKKEGLRKLTFLEQMISLAHEMVHAKQFLRGELGYTKSGEFTWKKRKAGGYKYKNQPWEKEAVKRESQLFVKCFPFKLYNE